MSLDKEAGEKQDQTRYYTSNDRPSNIHCYIFMSLLAVSSM